MSHNWLHTPDVYSLSENEENVSCVGGSNRSQEGTHLSSQLQAVHVKVPEANCLPEAEKHSEVGSKDQPSAGPTTPLGQHSTLLDNLSVLYPK